MTITIFTTDGAQTQVESEHAQDVLIRLELPIKSPWLKVKANHGWHWIDRDKIVRVKVFE